MLGPSHCIQNIDLLYAEYLSLLHKIVWWFGIKELLLFCLKQCSASQVFFIAETIPLILFQVHQMKRKLNKRQLLVMYFRFAVQQSALESFCTFFNVLVYYWIVHTVTHIHQLFKPITHWYPYSNKLLLNFHPVVLFSSIVETYSKIAIG